MAESPPSSTQENVQGESNLKGQPITLHKQQQVNLYMNKQKIAAILLNHPKSMDDDNLLQALVWKGEMAGNPNISAMDFLRLYSAGSFTSPETIRRCRQKLQEEYPHLRGNKYKVRHEHQETWKKDLGY
jgi:hypothetical protein